MSNINRNNYITPDPFAPKNVKDSEDYARTVVNYIIGTTRTYREKRNEVFQRNRTYAEGKQSINHLLDQLDINGKPTYTNIIFKPRPISRKFERIVVDGYMLQKKEYAKVKSISKHIVDAKKQKRTDAQFRMDNKDFIRMLSMETGIPAEDPNAFTPESIEELDIYYNLNDKEEEELLMQDTITFLLNNMDIESMKRNILKELYQVNLVGLYNYIDNKGKWVADLIKGEDCYYSNTSKDDFSDIHFAGRNVRMTVSALRNRFKIKDERSFFKAIKNCYTGSGFNVEWKDSYLGLDSRPYDSLIVEMQHVWFKCSKILEYTKGYDRYGRKVYDINDFNGDTSDLGGFKTKAEGRKMTGHEYPETAYEGYVLGENGYVLEWGEQKNILRGQTDGNIICPFIFHMADNNGKMLSQSSVEMIIDNIDAMDLDIHKIKQAIAKSAPDGMVIDIDSLEELDLGTGGKLTPLSIMQIYRQTGDIYYRGKKEDGTLNQVPIRPAISSIANTLEAYISDYNFQLTQIRDILGINEIRDGSAVSPRISARFAQGQTEASNTATYVLYRGYLKMIESLVEQAGIRVWDNLKYGTPDNRFVKFLGTKNEELIKKKIDITQCAFEFKYELTMSSDEEGYLEQNIQTCLQNGTLEMPDAIMIRELTDFKVAQRMLAFILEKRRKQRMEEAQQNAQQQAESTAKAGESVELVKQQGDQMRAQLEMAKETERGKNESISKLMDIAKTLIETEVKEGKQIPDAYRGIIEVALANAGVKTEKSLTDTEKQIQQEQEQEAMEEQMQQLEQAVANGQISPEEAQQQLQMGV